MSNLGGFRTLQQKTIQQSIGKVSKLLKYNFKKLKILPGKAN